MWATTLLAVERLAPDLYHSADSHLPELAAVLREAVVAIERKLG